MNPDPERRTKWKIPRPEGWVILLLTVVVPGILLLTLSPQGAERSLGIHPLCFACGHAPLANIARNIILFLPFGFLLGRWLGWATPVLLVSMALSAGIELAQTRIPGRNPLVIDVLANGTGGWLGGLL
ncbi:MAG: VanZ family protein, partial [Gemmatimonadales bacterium]